mgnify:CR=1 FL=1
MDIIWIDPEAGAEEHILVGDAGGTNTSFALAGRSGRRHFLLGKFLFRTRDLGSLGEAAAGALGEILRLRPSLRIRRCCISAAGPVKDNVCRLTNAPWVADGGELSRRLGIPTRIINDFTAIAYGLPLLDPADPRALTPIPREDGHLPSPSGTVRAVIGAGTGLGVGCLVETGGGFLAIPSEGGHIDFSGFDRESRELVRELEDRIGGVAEAELLVSGLGLLNIRDMVRRRRGGPVSPAMREIDGVGDDEKPALISAWADRDPECAEIMRLFTRFYGRVAANIATVFLPTAGLYLAGGIAAKNRDWFLRPGGFMEAFSLGYRRIIRDILREIPVYIVRDYSISLLGAAHADTVLPRDDEGGTP